MVVKKNLLLVRYSFERAGKLFRRGELHRRWGEKVTMGKSQSKTDARAKRVGSDRRCSSLVRALTYLVAPKLTLNPHTQNRRMRHPNSLKRLSGHPPCASPLLDAN